MDIFGIKTAILGFIFVCVVKPELVKNRSQFFLAVVAVLVAMFFQALAVMLGGAPVAMNAFGRVCLVMNLLLDIFAILLLVMSAGGLSVRQLAGDMAGAFEVMRRGEQAKTVIIPIAGQVPRQAAAPPVRDRDEQQRTVYVIDDPEARQPAEDDDDDDEAAGDEQARDQQRKNE
jgi:hypothetical protein